MKLKIIFLVLLGSFLKEKVSAQISVPDSMINVVPAWSLNDTVYYSKELNFWQIMGKDTIANRSESYLIRVVFLGQTDSSYEVEWSYFLVMDSLKNDSLEYYYEPLYTLNYYMDSLGVFVDADVMDLNLKQMILMQATQRINGNTSVDFLKNGDNYSNTNSVRNTMFEDIMEYHRYFGYMYTANDTIVCDMYDIQPTKNILKGFDRFWVSKMDTTHFYSIVSEEKIFQSYLKKAYDEELNNSNYTLKERAQLSKLMSNLNGVIKREWIFHETGWLISGFYRKEVVSNHMSMIHDIKLSYVTQ
ncbi:hypothetical protein [Gynurincola endophyticus]|uniref:hypothetical protein n=1 Tax=Gynurincola endophyticus TaxID=2479004 RepID=UPI000F8EAB49|nr:hypothetical protein [Gynurincola endophyticus]